MKKRDDVYAQQILDRITLVNKHLRGVSASKFLKSHLHQSAVIRELEIIGESARHISEASQLLFSKIPWKQIIGMRNRLIHEYFSVDASIVWEVATRHLPELEPQFQQLHLETAPLSHPWRVCPLGYSYVRSHQRKEAPVRAHCRRNPTGRDQLYPDEIALIAETGAKQITTALPRMLAPKNANDFDVQIQLWTKYWNDVFAPADPLPPEVVKALFFSESSFRLDVKDQRASTRNMARGPLQVTDETRRILADENGELKNHHLTLSAAEIKDLSNALAASIRWLFHKRALASSYLKKTATWEEAVADYKAYLRRKKDFRKQQGMANFYKALNEMKKTP
jgi:uncharacterized protein with HEPN domain